MFFNKPIVHQSSNSGLKLVRVRAIAATMILQTGVDSEIGENVRDFLESCTTHRRMIRLRLKSSHCFKNGDHTGLNKLRLRGLGSEISFSPHRSEERRLQFRMRGPVRCIELNWNVKLRQMAIKCRPDNSPFELSHSTAKRWNGEGFNAPILVT